MQRSRRMCLGVDRPLLLTPHNAVSPCKIERYGNTSRLKLKRLKVHSHASDQNVNGLLKDK